MRILIFTFLLSLFYVGSVFAQPINVAYVNDASKVMVETAAQPDNDPIIQLLNADPNINLTVLLVAATDVVDLSGYDVVIGQEGFNSSAAIFAPGGSLGMGSIPVPFILNKAYTMRAGRGFAAGTAGSGGEAEGTLYLTVTPENQVNPLFNGITFDGDSAQVFFTGAADDGGDTRTKGLQYATDVVISVENTKLASGVNDPENATVCVNDIPAGTTIGSEITQARMIAFAMNFGAICKDNAGNMTSAGLTLWRNAVYILGGLEVPTTPVVVTTSLEAVTASVGTTALNDGEKAMQLTLPAGTSSADLVITTVDAAATVTVPPINVASGATETYEVVVSSIGLSDTYTLVVHQQAAGEILYQSADSRGVYGVGKAYDTNVYDALVGAGYSVTYSQKGAINNADFDYSPYAAIVISAGESSGNVNTFAIAGYPIPCVTMQPDAPRSSKWGWTNSDKSGDASGQMMVTKIYDAETCKIKVTNNSHPITAGYAVDELITWSSGTAESEDFLGKEIKSYDLSANIPDAVALATIPADGTLLPTMWAVPAGASVNTKMPDGVVPVTLENSIVFMAVFNDGLLYMTDDFKPLLLSSLDWAITSSSACEFVPYYDNLTNLTPDPECSDLSLWGGWGLKSIVGPDSAYCGETAILLSDPTGAGCKWPDGSAALDVAPPNWLPNTTYHLRAMVKTVNGPIGFLASGSIDGSGPGGIDFGFPLDTHGEWVQLDTTFTTSDAPVQNFYSFNTCDYASTATETYIDNYELYALPAAASPKEIVFVKTENNNNDSIVVAAITNYADGTAYNVTVIEQGIITEDLLPQLNAADVVIMGRSIPSGDAATGKDVWDQITAPVLSMNMWAMRSSRALWTPSASCENMKQADDQFFQGVIVAPDDPVFKGITTEPFDWWWGNYSDFGVDAEGDDAGNGTLLAQTPDGKMLFARWEAGVEFYPGSGQIPQGERVYIGNGSDDGGVIAYFNWSETSELIFWRELARLSGYEMPATIADKVVIFVTDDNEDHEQIEWLESKGVNVTTYYPAGGLAAAPQEEIDMLNAADLIIVGRSPNSGDFDAPDKEAWNAITAPMIFNSQWVARNSRLNMFNSGNAIHENIGPDIAYGAVLDPNDVAFSFVEPTDGLLDWCTPPHDFIADVMETNGTILATWDQNPNAPLFARFEAGVEYYPGSVDMPAGPRTYFGFGNDNLGVVFFFPLTDNAKKVYWAEILNMLNLPVEEEIVSPDPYAILDPAYLDPASLGEGMSIVEMDGKAYVQVILNGWNSTITVPTFTLGEGWTAVADFKYSVADGAAFTLNQINAVVQIMDNVNKIPNPWGGTDPVPSSTGLVQSPATGDWKYVTAGVSADMKIVDMVQFFGQETVGWGPTVGDTMWIGKVRAMPVDPNVIVDPETFDPAKLNAGWEVVEISGKKYFKISLDGWSSWQGIPEYKFPEGTTGFKCMAKYEEGTSGFTVDQVNTFLKLSDPNWTEISAAGQASSATFIEYNVDIANTSMNAGVFQVAGQETTGWSAVAGDILYVGKLEVVLPIQKAPITFVIDDTKHKKYDGFSIRGSWVTATGEYDASWSGGVNHAQFTDDNGDNVWELTIELVPDGGANTWKWGFLDLNDTWLVTGADPTFTVVDATPQTITYIVGGTDVDFFSKNLSIYPNPVDNVLNISGVEIQSVKVLNLNGMVVLSEENTSGRIDLSSLKRGAYIVQVNGMNNEVAIRKLMKN